MDKFQGPSIELIGSAKIELEGRNFCLLINEQGLLSDTVESLFLVSGIITSQSCSAGIILQLLNFLCV